MRDLNRPTAVVALHRFALERWRGLCSMSRLMTQPILRKSDLRREALLRRSQERAPGMDARLRDQGLEFVAAFPGEAVSGFMPMRDELSPLALMAALRQRGKRLAMPVVTGKGAALIFRAWSPGDAIATAKFGQQEPLQSAAAVQPDVLLVPLAAFDRTGHRIGYGGGFYDRTLAQLRAARQIIAVGIAYDCQEVAPFHAEAHDQKLDFILTPSGVRRPGD